MKQFLVEFEYLDNYFKKPFGEKGSLIVNAKSKYEAHIIVQAFTRRSTSYAEITNIKEITKEQGR